MPAKFRFVNRWLVLAAGVFVCAGDLPLAVAQADAPTSEQPAADKKAKRIANKRGAAKSDSAEQQATETERGGKKGTEKKSTEKKDTEKKDTEKKDTEKKGTEKKGTEKKGTEKKGTEKKVAKAQRESSAKPADASGSPAASRNLSEAEREEAALALVREHHPALVELLERLKATKQADYQQAVKELYHDSHRLAVIQERDAERYAMELRAWQLGSRIRLLAARLSLEDRPELEEELKTCLTERAKVRLSVKKLERDRAVLRAKKLDEEIEKLTVGQEADVNRSFERLLRAAQKAAGSRRGGVKKAADGAGAEAASAATQADRPQASAAKGEPSAP